MNKYQQVYSLATILLLYGCADSTGDKYQANNQEVHTLQNTYIDKKGFNGFVLADEYITNATVCFDEDSNAKCDENEVKEKTYENGKYSFSQYAYNKVENKNAPLLAVYSQDNQDQMILSSTNNNITAFTTLVNNELLYNPYVTTKEEAVDSLKNRAILNLDENYLNSQTYSNDINAKQIAGKLVKSFNSALELQNTNPNIDKYSAIATAVDEIIKNDLPLVNVTTLNTQERSNESFSTTKLTNITLPSPNTRQSITSIANNDTNLLIQSKWNNNLTVLSPTNLSIINSTDYLNGANGDDISSGASEKYVKKTILSSDNTELYSLINKEENTNSDFGLGIYNNDFINKAPIRKYASQEGKLYFNSSGLKDLALSNDNLQLVSVKENTILLFQANDLGVYESINTPQNLNEVTFSQDNLNVIAISDSKLFIYKKSDKSLLGQISLSTALQNLNTIDNNTLLLTINNEILILDISDASNITINKRITADTNINNITLSKDKTKAVVNFHNSTKIQSFILSNGVNKIDTFPKIIQDVKFFGNEYFNVVSDHIVYKNSINGTGVIWDLTKKNNWKTTHRNNK